MSSSLFMSIFNYQRTLIGYILGYTAPHHLSCYLCIYTIIICNCYQKYYNFFNFFTLSHQWDFIWCLTSILLLYSANLKMSILFLNFFYFFLCLPCCPFTFIICTHFKFYAYFLKFFFNNFKHIILTVYSPPCSLSYYYILKLIYLFFVVYTLLYAFTF